MSDTQVKPYPSRTNLLTVCFLFCVSTLWLLSRVVDFHLNALEWQFTPVLPKGNLSIRKVHVFNQTYDIGFSTQDTFLRIN